MECGVERLHPGVHNALFVALPNRRIDDQNGDQSIAAGIAFAALLCFVDVESESKQLS